ncbi:unnamed protein product [Blumeria hordei]|uniref:Fungal-type protein kinase domain-containing protein n=1 Tax=Blumeria hordei TaxID=2867405 RepID=A0A383UNW3_BLUHO|nr:unnamed protein product [Blumeria hordei]
MDQYPEILAHITENSIEYIFEEFRNNCRNGSSLKTALVRMHSEIAYYTTLFSASFEMSSLTESFREISDLVKDNDINLHRFDHLIHAIFKNKNERYILDLSLKIIRAEYKQSPLTTPTNSITSYAGSYTEIMHFDKVAEKLRDDLDLDIDNQVFHSIQNFWKVFFVKKRWSEQTSRIWESYQKYENAEMKRRSRELEKLEKPKDIRRLNNRHQSLKEKVFVINMNESEVWEWLGFFKETFLDQLQGYLPKSSTEHPVVIEKEGFQLRGQFCRTGITRLAVDSADFSETDFMIKSIDLPVDCPVDGEDINVLGEFDKSPRGNVRQEKFMRLSRSVRDVFCAQPLRRFMHGFCLFREEFELWLFDRSGAYGSGLLSIVDDKEILIRALSSYLLMSDEELGRDMSILQKGEDMFVQFPKSENIEGPSYEIKSKPVVRPMGLVSQGATYYETKDESTVIKYSWSKPKKDTEAELLNIASSVPGVVNCLNSEIFYETKSHLDGLDLVQATHWTLNADKKYIRKSSHVNLTTKPSMERNRRLTRIAMTPRGRKIYSSGSILDFVAGIRDAIKGHEGLVGKGILHGHISEENIIMLKPNSENDPHGMLIDLDRSDKMRGNLIWDNDRKFMGTLKFMALEQLESAHRRKEFTRRTYRHDLEAFFYVFIVGCIEYERASKSTRRDLSTWSSNDIEKNYFSKMVYVVQFHMLLDEFTPSFEGLKELAKKLRQILFKDHGRYIETPDDYGPLYKRMIKAFDETIEDIRAERIKNKIFHQCRN